MNYDATDADGFVAVQAAYSSGAGLDTQVLDEDGAGISGTFIVTKFDGVEENDQIVEVEVELRPDFRAEDPPEDI
jgi:predicted secreted protein